MMDRREFLKAVSKILVAVGGAKFFTEEELLALENGEIKIIDTQDDSLDYKENINLSSSPITIEPTPLDNVPYEIQI